METLIKDLRYGYRTLLRNPGFTVIAVLSLALGIGANTAIFSFVNTIMLRTLPVRDPQRLALFGAGTRRGNSGGPTKGSDNQFFSWREYQDFRTENAVFDDIVAVSSMSIRVYADFTGAREGLLATLVSGNFFRVLDVKPEAGVFFDSSADRAPGASPLAVLSDAFWARRFHRDPKVIGQTFRIGTREYTVAGITPKSFFGTRVGELPDMWAPLTMLPEFPSSDLAKIDDPHSHFLNLIGSLKPGVDLTKASANVDLLYRRILPRYVGNPAAPGELEAIPTARIELTHADKGLSSLRRRYETPLLVLMAVVGLVLTIACANVANLLMALGAKRQREMAVRIAIGAGRGRLIRQLVTEGVMLAGTAALLGVVLASGAGRILVSLISTGPNVLPLRFEMDVRVLGFTVGVSVLTGLLFSLAPALRASGVDLSSTLKEGKASMSSPRKVTFGRAMVVGQVALSLTLLVSAGMLLRSFANLIATGTGFDRNNVLLFKIDSESSGYKQDGALGALYNRIGESVSKAPGAAAAAVSLFSFSEGHWSENFKTPGAAVNVSDQISLNFVTPGFFDTFRIPLLAGRAFNNGDARNSLPVVIINETFARQVFGGNGAVGRIIEMAPVTDKDVSYQIVGVVRDIKSQDVRDKDEKQAWLPLGQSPVYAGTVAVRFNGDAGRTASGVRAAIHLLEPNLPIRWTTTLADEVNDSLVGERALAELSAFFAGLALLLSAIGLYGTISFAVARRTSEIGIRMALGAEQSGVLGMVLKDALILLGIGVAIGLPLSIGAGRALQSLLYGLGSFDPISAVGAVVSLAAVAAIAGYLPARRASHVDPIVALRYE